MASAPWQHCRRCCCRYGIFPVLVVPIVSFGWLLSLYSSVGCKFIDLEIGFQPVNVGWEATSPYSFGPLFYHNQTVEHDSMYRQTFHGGCEAYSDEMYENYVSHDRTFKMIQIMTLISIAASTLAMAVAWLFVISPVPADFLWPAVLLPSIMVAFICEGAKFLIFDTGVCRSAMWYRGSLLVPEKAESCRMGETGWFACAAGVLHFWALVCVCLRSPERRIDDTPFDPLATADASKEEEETSDTPDLEGACGGGSSNTDSQVVVVMDEDPEKLSGKELLILPRLADLPEKAIANTIGSFTELMDSTSCNASDLPLKLGPIDTSFGNCCSPMSEGKPATASPELIPDVPERRVEDAPISPVDFIIEGFDVATDFSQINVCRTMSWLPAQQKALEDSGSSGLTATAQDDSTGDTKDPTATTQALRQKEAPSQAQAQAQAQMQPQQAPENAMQPIPSKEHATSPLEEAVPAKEIPPTREAPALEVPAKEIPPTREAPALEAPSLKDPAKDAPSDDQHNKPAPMFLRLSETRSNDENAPPSPST
ncbi:expressed unknown protein [Seminavis robusta]|uniref:Uncharacterized protein n=1 Tax=Seminavis robusta TaxID=568900 RepID=A0A9N8HBX0_9STRA|nr:expressed unknown protein [Seminavis robusta]|eukprot:Sro355_g124980.1 n/a (540) ;mRNA; r:15033-16782